MFDLSSLVVDPKATDWNNILKIVEQEELNRLKERAKDDYLSYCQYVHEGAFVPNRHSSLICNVIDKAVKRAESIQRRVDKGLPISSDDGVIPILISLPPQHGKSMAIAETLPSYFNARNPDKTTMLISYNQDSARRFGRKNRHKLKNHAPVLFGEQIDDRNSSVEEFGIKGHTGLIRSIGVNGSITGYAGNLIIIDDPYKNSSDANSPAIRGTIQNIFDDSISTRMHPGTLLIVVHTRWHEDDLIAYLERFYKQRAQVVRIPAECEDVDSDPLHRELGEFLWADHHGVEYYLDKKKNRRVWNALYQQNPTPQDGSLFKKSEFRFYNKESLYLPNTTKVDVSKFKRICMSWDCTFEGDATSDYVAGQVWGMTPNGDYYLLHRIKKQLDFTDTASTIHDVTKLFPTVKNIIIEKKANGHAIINTLEKVYNIKTIAEVPKESKEVRASAIAYVVNDGRVFLPDDIVDLEDFLTEFTNFPKGRHDDEVDAFSQAMRWMEDKNRKVKKRII